MTTYALVKATEAGAVLRYTAPSGRKGWTAVSPNGAVTNEFTRKEAERALIHRAAR